MAYVPGRLRSAIVRSNIAGRNTSTPIVIVLLPGLGYWDDAIAWDDATAWVD